MLLESLKESFRYYHPLSLQLFSFISSLSFQQLPWEKWCKLVVPFFFFSNAKHKEETERANNLVFIGRNGMGWLKKKGGYEMLNMVLWLFNKVARCFRSSLLFCCFSNCHCLCAYIFASRWDMKVECRYLFYNSLNKRMKSSLCLFIQFSLRSIISTFFFFLFFFPFNFHFIAVDVVISSQQGSVTSNNRESFLTRVFYKSRFRRRKVRKVDEKMKKIEKRNIMRRLGASLPSRVLLIIQSSHNS